MCRHTNTQSPPVTPSPTSLGPAQWARSYTAPSPHLSLIPPPLIAQSSHPSEPPTCLAVASLVMSPCSCTTPSMGAMGCARAGGQAGTQWMRSCGNARSHAQMHVNQDIATPALLYPAWHHHRHHHQHRHHPHHHHHHHHHRSALGASHWRPPPPSHLAPRPERPQSSGGHLAPPYPPTLSSNPHTAYWQHST